MNKILTVIIIILFASSSGFCQSDTVIKIGNDYKISFHKEWETDYYYQKIIIYKNEEIIFTDKTNQQYLFDNSLFPLINNIKNGFELFIEIDGRPNKNTLRYFKLQNAKVQVDNELPEFETISKNLDNDSLLELAGFWYYGEEWKDINNNDVTGYNPIVYYELTPNGIRLDSMLTIYKNTEIYEKFYGFDFNENIEVSTNKNVRFKKELYRIEKMK